MNGDFVCDGEKVETLARWIPDQITAQMGSFHDHYILAHNVSQSSGKTILHTWFNAQAYHSLGTRVAANFSKIDS